MLLPSFHHPKSSQDRRLGVAGAAVARAGAAGRAGGAPKMMGFPWFPQRCVGLIRSKHHHQNLVDFLECIYIILNMDFSMVDLMSKEWGDCFAFFFHQKWSGVVILKPRTSKNYFLNMITILCWMGVKIQTFKHWFAAQKHGGRVIVFAGDPLNLDKVNQDRIRTEIQKIQHDTYVFS